MLGTSRLQTMAMPDPSVFLSVPLRPGELGLRTGRCISKQTLLPVLSTEDRCASRFARVVILGSPSHLPLPISEVSLLRWSVPCSPSPWKPSSSPGCWLGQCLHCHPARPSAVSTRDAMRAYRLGEAAALEWCSWRQTTDPQLPQLWPLHTALLVPEGTSSPSICQFPKHHPRVKEVLVTQVSDTF